MMKGKLVTQILTVTEALTMFISMVALFDLWTWVMIGRFFIMERVIDFFK